MTVAINTHNFVDSFDQTLDEINFFTRKNLPFTYVAYRSLIPEKEDDWYWLASRTAWCIFMIFNFVKMASAYLSWACAAIPFMPFIFDGIRAVVLYIRPKCDLMPNLPPALVKCIHFIGVVAFCAIGVTVLLSKDSPFVS